MEQAEAGGGDPTHSPTPAFSQRSLGPELSFHGGSFTPTALTHPHAPIYPPSVTNCPSADKAALSGLHSGNKPRLLPL